MNDLGVDNSVPAIGAPPRWMISFADLMSVILTFFVLLFSMAAPPSTEDQKDNGLEKTEEAAFSVNKGTNDTNIKTARTDQDLSTNYLADVIQNRMATYPELAKAKLEATDDKLSISITASEFNDEYAANMAQILKSLDNKAAIYSAVLDQSKAVVEKLQEKDVEKNIAFYESKDMAGKIDIIIYP